MPGTPTIRLKLPLPAQTDPADVPTDLGKLANALDPVAAVFTTGSGAPATPGTAGRFYWRTDTRTLYFDDGTTWQPIAGPSAGPAWIIVSNLLNGWTTNQTVAYQKDALGFVWCKGILTPGNNVQSAFNLPAGYRPATILRMPAGVSGGSGTGYIQMGPGGDVIPSWVGTAPNGVSLDGMRFLAEG
jgi:hypothetical protein